MADREGWFQEYIDSLPIKDKIFMFLYGRYLGFTDFCWLITRKTIKKPLCDGRHWKSVLCENCIDNTYCALTKEGHGHKNGIFEKLFLEKKNIDADS